MCTMGNEAVRSGTATLLSDKGRPVAFPCMSVQHSSPYLQFEAGRRACRDQALTIEVEGVLFLGEVVECIPLGPAFSYRIIVTQKVTGVQSLMRLRVALLGWAEEPRIGNGGAGTGAYLDFQFTGSFA